MKELSIEQKARAYDEALEKAKRLYGEGTITECLCHIFPELKESRDEKIRKLLIRLFTSNTNEKFDDVSTQDILAWLEKQKQDDLTNYKKTSSNYDEAEKEKCDFVGDGFIKCYADFQDFKEGETYWFEYIGDDKYNVRSDNLLGKTYHITPCQLYTIFKKQTWLEKQGAHKLAWSEEDEHRAEDTIYFLDTAKKHYASTVGLDACIDWLQSLKQRIGG